MIKPTIVCVPGAWHKSAIYDPLRTHLSPSYPVRLLDLPSAGAIPPHADFSLDVQGIRAVLKQLIEDEGKDVVLVMHSYAGMLGSEACVGLGKKEREGKGERGGVVRLVYVAALALKEGVKLTEMGMDFPDWMEIGVLEGGKEDEPIFRVSTENAKKIFYNDLPDAEAELCASKIVHQSAGVFGSETTYAAWRHIPSTFVVPTLDQTFFKAEIIEWMLGMAREVEPTAFDVVEKIEAGHCVMLSKSEWLAGVVRRAAGEV